MNNILNAFKNYPIQTGFILICVCVVLIIIELITLDSPKIKNLKTISWKAFFKKWFFLLIFMIYGLILILKNL